MVALLFVCSIGGVLAAPGADAAGNGALNGTVTHSGGGPISGLTVEARQSFYGTVVATTTTSATGTYSFPSIPAGSYRVRYVDPNGAWPTWYSGNVTTWSAAAKVTLATGGTTVSDAVLPLVLPQLHGTARHTGGGGIPGITVEARHSFYGTVIASSTTAADGSYGFNGLGAGSYRVRFFDPGGAWRTWYSGNAATWAASTPVAVTTTGSVQTDVTLPDDDNIIGTVTDMSGTPLPGSVITVLDASQSPISSAIAGPTGRYTLANLPASTRTLRFSDPTGQRATKYAGDSNSFAGATVLSMPGTGLTIDQSLPLGGTLTGQVRLGDEPAPGVVIRVFDAATPTLVATGVTGVDGNWEVDLVPPGSFKIAAGGADGSPASGPRTEMIPDLDVASAGLPAAHSGATPFAVAESSSTPTGTQQVSGADCDPTVFHPGADLEGRNLAGNDLRACDLTGATFVDVFAFFSFGDVLMYYSDVSNMAGTMLAHADLTDADLVALQLAAADPDLSGTNLTGTQQHFTCTWEQSNCYFPSGSMGPVSFSTAHYPAPSLAARGAAFRSAIAPAHDFTGNDASGVDFSGAVLNGTTFDGTDLDGADLSGASCHDCRITDASAVSADLTGIDLNDGSGNPNNRSDLANADLTNADLTNADLGYVKLTNATVSGTALSGARLDHSQLQTSTGLTGPQLAASHDDLTGANLSGLNLSGADLTGNVLADVTFTGANLGGATITGANLTSANGLTGAQATSTVHNWAGTSFAGTGLNLAGTNFASGGYTVVGASFAGLNLTHTVWTGVNLTGVDFSGADLSGAVGLDWSSMDLAGLDLTGINLSGQNLSGADLTGTTLVGANLSGANVTGATFDGTHITSANLTNVVGLTQAQLLATDHNWNGAVLVGADLSGLDLSVGSDFSLFGVDFSSADLSGTDLTGKSLTHAKFHNADLTGTIITGVSFSYATHLASSALLTTNHDWTGTDFESARSGTIAHINLSGVDFVGGGFTLAGAKLRGINLVGANLAGMDLTGTWLAGWCEGGLGGCDLSNVNLSGADLTGGDLQSANLAGANLGGADLTDANLQNASLPAATVLTGATFANTDVSGADFTANATLTQAQAMATSSSWELTSFSNTSVAFTGFDFVAAGRNIRGTKFRGLNLSGANLAGLDLSLMEFDSATMTGASLAGVTAGFASFDYANLTNANFAGAHFESVDGEYEGWYTGYTIRGATITGANFTNATGMTANQVRRAKHQWQNLTLTGTGLDLSGTNFNSGLYTLVGVDLPGLNLTNTVFTNKNLTGTDLSGANLTGAAMGGANLSGASLLGATGNPAGGSSATYNATVCPDGVVTNGTTVPTCVGHGLSA